MVGGHGVVVGLGLLVLVDLEGHLRVTRARQRDMEKKFEPQDRKLAGGKRRMPQLVFAVLCGVVIVAGGLAAYAIWQLP